MDVRFQGQLILAAVVPSGTHASSGKFSTFSLSCRDSYRSTKKGRGGMWSLEDSRSNLSPLDVVSWSQMERLSACVILAATVPSGTHAGTLVKPSSVLEKDIYVWSPSIGLQCGIMGRVPWCKVYMKAVPAVHLFYSTCEGPSAHRRCPQVG